MTVTLTASYKETLQPETVALIDNLIEDNYELSDMLEFIDENSEEDFRNYYEEYCEQGENLGYDVVDAFVSENGLDDIEHVEDAFVGRYDSEEAFAEEFTLDHQGMELPDWVVVDWEATWNHNLRYDFDFVVHEFQGFVFNKNW